MENFKLSIPKYVLNNVNRSTLFGAADGKDIYKIFI